MQEKRISHEEIARVAYLLWEEEGRPEGMAREHWLRAEAILRKKLEVSAKPGSASEKRRKPPRKKSDAPHSSEKRESSSKAGAKKSGFQRRAAAKKSRRKTRDFAQKGRKKPPRAIRARRSSSD